MLQKNLAKLGQSDIGTGSTSTSEPELLNVLKTIYDNLPIGVVYLDSDYNFISANKAIYDLTGLGEEDLLGKKCYETTGEFKDDPTKQGLEKVCSFCKKEDCFNTKESTVMERPIGDRFIRVTTIPELYPDGNIYRFLEIVEDITEQRKAQELLQRAHDDMELQVKERTSALEETNKKLLEEIAEREKVQKALLENEEHMKLAFEGTDGGTWDWDVTTGEIKFDENWPKVLGYNPHERKFDFDWWSKSVHPDSKPIFEKAMNAYLEGKEKFYELEYQIKNKNGDWRWIWARGKCTSFDEKGRPQRMTGTHQDITRKKRAEEELKNTKELFEKIFMSLDSAALILDNNSPPAIIDCNTASMDIFGYEKWEMLGRTTDFLHVSKEARNEFQEKLYPIIEKEGHLSSLEFKMKRKDGQIFHTEHAVLPLNDEKGNRTGWISLVRDITLHKQAQGKITEQNEFLNSIIEAIPYPFYVIDANDYKIQTANASVSRFGDWKDSTCHALTHQSGLPCNSHEHKCPLVEVKRTKKPAVVEHIHYDNAGNWNYYEVHGYPIFDSDGNVTRMIEFSLDITDRKKKEEAKAYLASITENSYDAIASLDIEGAFTSWNKGAEKIFGYKEEEMMGKSFGAIVPPELKNNCFELLDTVIEQGYLMGIESERIARDGSQVKVDITISLLRDDKDDPQGFIMILRDITERKKMELELLERQEELIMMTNELEEKNLQLEESNHLKDLFSDIMRHDILNPIGIIRTSAEMALEDNPEDEDLNLIARSVKRAGELIDNATMLSKLESSEDFEKEDIDLKEILDRISSDMNPLFETGEMDLFNNIMSPMPLKANPIIDHVFINFLSNAIKYAPEGKKAVIEGEDTGDSWIVKVLDFGEGIRDEYKEGIFDRFKRKNKDGVKGSGLGLSIVKKIVDIHRGKIWIDDNPEGGSVFVVELPKK